MERINFMDNTSSIIESRTFNYTKNSYIENYRFTKLDYKTFKRFKTIERDYPLGYGLFTIMETLDDIKKNKDSNHRVNIIRDKYYEKVFFDTFLYSHYSLLIIPEDYYADLQMIQYFLDVCSKNIKYCSIEYLLVLLSSHALEMKPLNQIVGIDSQKGNMFNCKSEDSIKKMFDMYESDKSNSSFFYSYEYTSLLDLCIASLQCIFNEGYIIRKCENCGKYFIPTTRSDEIYCDNVFKGNRTCKQIGYEQKINSDEFMKAYRTAYKTKNAFKNRNKLNNTHAEENFEKWVIQAKEKLKYAQSGSISLDEFKQWLKS